MMRWLGNIVISIAVANLDEIYSYAPIDMISPLVRDSTIAILQKSLTILDSDIPVLYHCGRTIVVEMYGHSNYVNGIRIDSCLDVDETEAIMKKFLDAIE